MITGLYHALTRLLPRRVRDQDADEMVHALRDQIAAAPSPAAVGWRALSRFPLVLALEWRDSLLSPRAPTPLPHDRGGHMEPIARMIRQGARGLARTPAFSLSVILLLAIGVGSVSAIFAVVDHVLLRPLPYPAAERLVTIGTGAHSIPAINDMRVMHSIEAWSAATTHDAHLIGQGDPQRVRQALVSDGFFPMFGARAFAGRLLLPADSMTPSTAVISYATWTRLFGGDRSIVGRTIRIDGAPVTVVGVLDQGFVAPEAMVGAAVDLWRPLDRSAEYMTHRDSWMFKVVGRLAPTATIALAQQEAQRVAHDRAKEFPERYTDGGHISELPVRTLRDATAGTVAKPLRLLLGAVALLLLVACTNVTHLFLARSVGRGREMALRRALGARTRSLIAQLLIESTMLGAAGAALGALIAYAGVRAFLTLAPSGLPRADTISVDARVLLFAGGIGMLTAGIFGLVPAMRLARRGRGDPLRNAGRTLTAGRTAYRVRSALIVGEVAISLVLVTQAGWLLRSFMRMTHADLGFRTTGVVEIPLTIPPAIQPAPSADAEATEWQRRMEAMRVSLAETRGVKDATFGLTMPLQWRGGGRCCWSSRPAFTGKDHQSPVVTQPVSDDYFDVFAIGFASGAAWPRGSAVGSPYPAVINEVLAQEVYGSAAAALGASFALDKKSFRIVGVARNTRHYGADQPYETAVYVPASAIPFAPDEVTMAVRTDRVDDALAGELRRAIWRAEPTLPVPEISSITDLARKDAALRRFDAMLFGAFSAVSLLLVAGGLAGTLLYMVSLQRRNLGIRLALGATPRRLERGVLSNGVGLAAIGAALGVCGAWFAGRLMESQLFGVQARDIGTLGLAVAIILVLALLSSWIPARRAAATNPIESLRAE